MFTDDMKIWTKIKDIGDSEFLQQDLTLLMEWSKKWLFSFNMDECKVMYIGHNYQRYILCQAGITLYV